MIEYITKPTIDEAKGAASSEAADLASVPIPVTIFKQGSRTFFSAVLQLQFIVKQIHIKPLKKDKGISFGLTDVNLAFNRPLDTDHAKSTKEYLERNYNGKYILPAMTLNIQADVNVYLGNSKATMMPGYLVLPSGITFTITDGQHRKAALDLLYKDLPTDEFNKIASDGIPVMITTEQEISQIHQDFSDCSKTKQLPKSLIAVYDTRNPANALVMELVTRCPLFNGKVDAASSSLSKNSTKVLLVSQIRSLIKEIFLGNSATGDAELEKRAHEQYENSHTQAFKTDVEKFIKYINMVTEKIPVLKSVSKMTDGVEMSKIPALRNKFLILNAAGMNILGRVGNRLASDPDLLSDMEFYVDKLAAIDWEKKAEIWKGNIVQQGATGDKIATSNSTLKAAFEKVMTEIGLLTKQEEKKKAANEAAQRN